MASVLIAGVYGIIAGIAWSYALYSTFNGWFYGMIVGAIIGFCSFIIQSGVYRRGNVTKKETYAMAGSMFAIFLFIAIVAAIIAYIIRIIFF